jgi:hypothetical protein
MDAAHSKNPYTSTQVDEQPHGPLGANLIRRLKLDDIHYDTPFQDTAGEFA